MRRLVVVAGLGEDAGRDVVLRVCGALLELGRHPVAVDLACLDGGLDGGTDPGVDAAAVPVVTVACRPERLRQESPQVVSAILERLSRHESAGDTVVARISAESRLALARAAFLAGGVLLPVGSRDRDLEEAFSWVSELRECFAGLPVWPVPRDEAVASRFSKIVRDFLAVEPEPVAPTAPEVEQILDALLPPPPGGFLATLLEPQAPWAATPPAELLRTGTLRI